MRQSGDRRERTLNTVLGAGSDLYKSQIANGSDDLTRSVWAGTPWMVDAFTGPSMDDRSREMMDWCRNEFGVESWPIHGKPGNWHRGGVTLYGWTWMGFATEEMMLKFIERWPAPNNQVQAAPCLQGVAPATPG